MKKEKVENPELSFKLNEDIKERELTRRKLFLDNVIDLVKMHDENLFPAILGKGIDPSWSGFLSQIEVLYSRTKVERWRKIWKRFVVELKVDPKDFFSVPETRLEDIAKFVGDEDIDEWIEKAKQLIPSDWKHELKDLRGLPSKESCEHSHEVYRICKHCGDKIKQ